MSCLTQSGLSVGSGLVSGKALAADEFALSEGIPAANALPLTCNVEL